MYMTFIYIIYYICKYIYISQTLKTIGLCNFNVFCHQLMVNVLVSVKDD